jgi:TatD DNase family protein
MSLALFDSHAHLNSDAFEPDLANVIDRAKSAGVVGINVIGVDVETSRRACELASQHQGYLVATVGIQPNYVAKVTEEDWSAIEEMAGDPGVRAIGETGLDCYWDDAPLPLQREYFDRHIELAIAKSLPMVIHMRDSEAEIVDQLRSHSKLPAGVMHSYTGDAAIAKQCLDLGLYISFAGMVTFKKSDDLRNVARQVPLDRLLIETDSPYLSPEPFRGKRPNEPARVEHTLRCLAEVRNMHPRELSEITTANAKRLLRLP